MKLPPFRLAFLLLATFAITANAEDWPQFKFDSHHSGNAADRSIDISTLGLIGTVPASDGIYTAPVIWTAAFTSSTGRPS